MSEWNSDDPSSDDIRVMICDDHALFRRGLIMVLEAEDDIEVVAEAEDGDDEHRAAEHVDWVTEAVDRLDEDVHRHSEEQHRVGEGGKDLEAVPAERPVRPGRAAAVRLSVLLLVPDHVAVPDAGVPLHGVPARDAGGAHEHHPPGRP